MTLSTYFISFNPCILENDREEIIEPYFPTYFFRIWLNKGKDVKISS